MKILFRYIPILLATILVASCKKDNFDPPNVFLTGHIVYKGEEIQVERNRVPYQIYQYGFGKIGQIGDNTTFAQDGAYSQVLFNGTYKLIIPNLDKPEPKRKKKLKVEFFIFPPKHLSTLAFSSR